MKRPEQQSHNFEANAMRLLVGARLKARMSDEAQARAISEHPDDDVINAFVEGQLDEVESQSLTSHLVKCRSCLHLTARLIRLQPETEEIERAPAAEQDSGPLQRFVDRLTGGVLPSAGEDAVFAYHDTGEIKIGEETETDEEPSKDDSDPA